MDNVKLPSSMLAANSEGGKVREMRKMLASCRSGAGASKERVREGRGRSVVSRSYDSLLRSFTRGRRGMAQWSWVTVLLHLLSRSKPRKH